MHPHLENSSNLLGIELPAIERAAQLADSDLSKFKSEVPRIIEEIYQKEYPDIHKVDVVLLGSIAREESTAGSDCDYFILQNGASPDTTQDLLLAVEQAINILSFEQPGAQGVFGNIVIAPNLYECIGLDIDTNVNMTRRLLLLTESKSVLSEETYNSVIDNILIRYCSDYLPPVREKGSTAKIPRFLLNDLVRLWRTIAVDFGTKRWRTIKDDSHLRLVKLRIMRKILFAGPLSTLLMIPNRIECNTEMPQYLKEWLSMPPLAQIASTISDIKDEAKEALKILLINYDQFIDIYDRSRDFRNIMQNPKINKKQFEEYKKTCRDISDNIQSSLEIIFYDDDIFKTNFRKYAVF